VKKDFDFDADVNASSSGAHFSQNSLEYTPDFNGCNDFAGFAHLLVSL
jgi:hypothetical protein